MKKYEDKFGDFSKDEAYEFAKEFGVIMSKKEFNTIIGHLSSIKRIKYRTEFIFFERDYCFLSIKKGDEKEWYFGAIG